MTADPCVLAGESNRGQFDLKDMTLKTQPLESG